MYINYDARVHIIIFSMLVKNYFGTKRRNDYWIFSDITVMTWSEKLYQRNSFDILKNPGLRKF
jgi:hypothetical protein